jgi:2-polyprenyl-3-methyl-5-hydroxy-6-metoxy-1,4-benzoquinol methylase
MSKIIWDKIKDYMNDHSYMGKINRDEYRIKATAEIFTPTDLVIDMLQKTDLDCFLPGKTVLDPACGDGQFLVAIKYVKMLIHKMTEFDALQDIYGVDIMRDNVDLCKKRLGGGTILMGDSLNPEKEFVDQTKEEHQQMRILFLENSLERLFV